MAYKDDYDDKRLREYIEDGHRLKIFVKPKEAKPIPQNEEAPKKPSVSLYDKDDQFIKDQPSWIHNSTLTTFMTNQSESNVSTHQQNNDKQSNSSETTAEKTDYFNPTMKLSNFKNIIQKKEENATKNVVETCQCSECIQLMSDSPKKIKCHLCDVYFVFLLLSSSVFCCCPSGLTMLTASVTC